MRNELEANAHHQPAQSTTAKFWELPTQRIGKSSFLKTYGEKSYDIWEAVLDMAWTRFALGLHEGLGKLGCGTVCKRDDSWDKSEMERRTTSMSAGK